MHTRFTLLSILLALVALALYFGVHVAPFPHNGATLFEDGSFVIFFLAGCLPFQLCQ